MCTYATVYMWRSEDNLRELVLSFHFVGLQAISLGNRHLYLPSQLAGSSWKFSYIFLV